MSKNEQRLLAKQKECGFRMVKCCANCKWSEDDFINDYDYRHWCGNPENEDTEAKPGEDAAFAICDLNTCDKWSEKCIKRL